MAGGGNSGSSTTTQEVPGWLKDAYQANVQRATGIADTPFQAYNAPTQGADNSFYTDARSTIQQTQGVGLPQVAGASKIFGEVADQSPNLTGTRQLAGTNLDPYMNPYEDEVVKQSLADIQLQQDRALNGSNANTPRGAFGGSRQGVDDSLTKEAYARTAAQTAAGLRQGGFDRATGLASQDVDRLMNTDQFNVGADERNTALNLQGAQGLIGAGQAQQGLMLNQANALMGAGSQIKQAQDAIYGDQYQEFQRQQNDPYQKQQLLNQSVLGINAGGTTTSNSKGKGYSI